MSSPKIKYHKGIAYFQDVCDAAALVRKLGADSRVVAYERGYAVQYVRSGAYFPEYEGESAAQ